MDGNRTHHTLFERVHGFEDQGSHQTPVIPTLTNTSSYGSEKKPNSQQPSALSFQCGP